MREIYYAIYKNSDYKTMVMVSLAEAINSRRGQFENDRFILEDEIGLNLFEKQLLTRICLNGESHFHISDYHKWIAFLIKDCFSKEYLRKSLFLGPIPTEHFKTQLEDNRNQFSANIIEYIDSRDISHILKIDASLKRVILPEFRQLIQTKDVMDEMMTEVMNKGYWVEADKV
jgi:hypothetical protein